MKIVHTDGSETDTDKLTDVDSLLMEESKKLFDLYKKYQRQVCIIGEVREYTGCSFYNIVAKKDEIENKETPDISRKASARFYYSIDKFVRQISKNTMCLTNIPPVSMVP